MTICIIGGGLTSLSLAQNLVNKKINVHIYDVDKNKDLSSNRTIGISQNNLQFFKKEILDIKKSNFLTGVNGYIGVLLISKFLSIND